MPTPKVLGLQTDSSPDLIRPGLDSFLNSGQSPVVHFRCLGTVIICENWFIARDSVYVF